MSIIWTTSAGREGASGPRLVGTRRGLLAGLCLLVCAVTPVLKPADAADPFLVIAEQVDAQQPLDLPSIAPRLQSFQQVADALSTEQRRIAELEARLQQLEKKAVTAVEPLPEPKDGKKDDAAAAAGKKDDAKGGDKK